MKTSLLIFLFVLGTGLLFAQNKTLDREYVPITYNTAEAPFFGLTISEWTAYRYNQVADTWTAIPFQIDEMNEKGDRVDTEANGISDATDQIVFLPTDAGDKAPASKWIDDENSP